MAGGVSGHRRGLPDGIGVEAVNYRKDTGEPFWWGMFSAGGMVAARLVPIHISLDGLAVPLGLLEPEAAGHGRMSALLGHPLILLYLFVFMSLPLFHAAHRIRFSLYELGVRKHRLFVSVLCYGGALAGSGAAAFLLLKFL